MHSKLNLLLMVGLVVISSACSSSQTSESEVGPDEVPAAEAHTDAVPTASAETPAGDAVAPAIDGVPAADAKPAETAIPAPMADAKPADVATPVASADGAVQDYTIQKGDTLMQIAYETYGDLYKWKKVYEQNKDKIPSPSALVAGTVLKLEKPSSPVAIEKNGDRYLIKGGDTLGTISDDVYGTKKKWRQLWENNKTLIKNPNRIFAGFYLYYTMTPEEKQQSEELKGRKELAPAPMAQQEAPAVGAPTPFAPLAPAVTDERAPAAAVQ
jgi:nucleoid-associated protein YgaU